MSKYDVVAPLCVSAGNTAHIRTEHKHRFGKLQKWHAQFQSDTPLRRKRMQKWFGLIVASLATLRNLYLRSASYEDCVKWVEAQCLVVRIPYRKRYPNSDPTHTAKQNTDHIRVAPQGSEKGHFQLRNWVLGQQAAASSETATSSFNTSSHLHQAATAIVIRGRYIVICCVK